MTGGCGGENSFTTSPGSQRMEEEGGRSLSRQSRGISTLM